MVVELHLSLKHAQGLRPVPHSTPHVSVRALKTLLTLVNFINSGPECRPFLCRHVINGDICHRDANFGFDVPGIEGAVFDLMVG